MIDSQNDNIIGSEQDMVFYNGQMICLKTFMIPEKNYTKKL